MMCSDIATNLFISPIVCHAQSENRTAFLQKIFAQATLLALGEVMGGPVGKK